MFTFLSGKSLELAVPTTLLARLPVNYGQLYDYHELLWPFDHVNDS